MAESYFKTLYGREFEAGKGLPVVSTEIDSVRSFQFEVHFYGLPLERIAESVDLTLAAKQVSPAGITVEDIVADRLNDKLFYPGKATPDELTITFDHLYLRETTPALWDWFKTIYDPLTGDITKNSRPGGANTPHFKANRLEIVYLDNTKNPHATLEYYGVYPKSWKPSEHNYSTNEFHTIEVTFRWDFMDYRKLASN